MWEKIVLNLLSNAFKFTFEGSVSLKIESIDNFVRIHVSDTGVGISEEELPHMFERFHRVEGTRGRTMKARNWARAGARVGETASGNDCVTSKEGVGTTFTVTIPKGKEHLPSERIETARTLSSSAVRAESYVEEALRWLPESDSELAEIPRIKESRGLAVPSSAPSELDTGGELIVLADDNADMRDYLRRLLGERYRVHAVSNGDDAVKAARELHPNLVLTDVIMPGLDGFGVLRTLKDDPVTQAIPVILLSARAGEESRVKDCMPVRTIIWLSLLRRGNCWRE